LDYLCGNSALCINLFFFPQFGHAGVLSILLHRFFFLGHFLFFGFIGIFRRISGSPILIIPVLNRRVAKTLDETPDKVLLDTKCLTIGLRGMAKSWTAEREGAGRPGLMFLRVMQTQL